MLQLSALPKRIYDAVAEAFPLPRPQQPAPRGAGEPGRARLRGGVGCVWVRGMGGHAARKQRVEDGWTRAVTAVPLGRLVPEPNGTVVDRALSAVHCTDEGTPAR